MAGGLIPLCAELLEDLASGSMQGRCPNVQVPGDYNAWRSSIGHLWRSGVYTPKDEGQLGMWPIQCECTGIQSFGLSVSLSSLNCPLCGRPYYFAHKQRALLNAYSSSVKNRFAMIMSAMSIVDDLYAMPVSPEAADALDVMLALGVTTITGKQGRAEDAFAGMISKRVYVRRRLSWGLENP